MNDSDLEAFRAEWQREVQTKAKGHAAPNKSANKPISNTGKRPVADAANTTGQAVPTASKTIDEVSEVHKYATIPEHSDESDVSDIEDQFEAMSVEPQDAVSSEQPGDERQQALRSYEMGVEKERRGLLSEALILYRKAFKLYPSVDKVYRDAFRSGELIESNNEYKGGSLEESGYAKFIQVGHDYDPKNAHKSCAEFEDTMRIFSSLRMPIETAVAPQVTSIASLPDEILHQVLGYVMQIMPSSFTAISLTCQKFCLITQRDQSIWKDVCMGTYHNQLYDEEEGVQELSTIEPGHYSTRLQDEVCIDFQNDWKKMFIEKPRIRMDGCYIATCHYTRPGVREESFSSSFHLVTYFRFLRFYPSGTSLSLLTTSPPADVVHQIHLGSKLKGIQIGRWSMTRAGKLSIEATGPASYLFFMSLQVKSSSRGRQNKLQWDKFSGTHPVTGEITHFNLKNDKPFYFSKVISYTKRKG